MKQPEECSNIQDIRAEIDRLDRQIIAALGQRFKYVLTASKFKTSETSVKAPERLKSMLQERRICADQHGLNHQKLRIVRGETGAPYLVHGEEVSPLTHINRTK